MRHLMSGLAAAAVLAAPLAQAEEASAGGIGFVDAEEVLAALPLSASIEAGVNTEFTPLYADLRRRETEFLARMQMASRDRPFLSHAEAEAAGAALEKERTALEADAARLKQDRARRLAEARAAAFAEIRAATEAVRAEQGLTAIFSMDEVMACDPERDVSALVIEKMRH